MSAEPADAFRQRVRLSSRNNVERCGLSRGVLARLIFIVERVVTGFLPSFLQQQLNLLFGFLQRLLRLGG